ncbi:MAG: TonB-dependent receptor domain-containing protein [Calditrichia bacterium]
MTLGLIAAFGLANGLLANETESKLSLSGQVLDAATGQPLEGVNVLIEADERGGATDRQGRFLIAGMSEGRKLVSVSHIGYFTVDTMLTITATRSEKLLIYMDVEPVHLEEMVVERDMLVGSIGNLRNIPGSAHFISGEELEIHSNNDIHRALRGIPGVNMQEEDGFGLRPNIGFRGTGVERSQKITVMEDGVLAAPAPYAAPAAYYFPTVGRMHGIEVRKGSSQIKYGPNTTGGVLNLISSAIPEQHNLYAKIMGGSEFGGTLHARAGTSTLHSGVLLETFQAHSDGFKELDNGSDTGFLKGDYLLKGRLNTDPANVVYHELQLKVGYSEENSNETYLGLTDADYLVTPLRRYAGSQEDQMQTEHRQYSARYFARFSKGVDVTTTLYRNEFSRNWYKLDKVFLGTETVSIGSILDNPVAFEQEVAVLAGADSPTEDALQVKANNRDYFSQGVQSILGIQSNLFSVNHLLEVGLRLHEDEMDRFQWVDGYRMRDGVMTLSEAGVPGTESNRIESASSIATFAEYTLKMGALTGVGGMRHESISIRRDDYGKEDPQRSGLNLSSRENKLSVWVPGVGLKYELNPTLGIFAAAHKGFAPPGSKEETEAEESVNYEFGLRFNRQSSHLEIVAFRNDYSNLLGLDLNAGGGSGTGDLFNGGEVIAQGLEFAAATNLGQYLNNRVILPARLTYTYTNASFRSDFESDFDPWGDVQHGDELPYVSAHQLFMNIGWMTSSFLIDVSMRYAAAAPTIAGQGNRPDSEFTDAYAVFDASLEYSFNQRYQIVMLTKNLTDLTYVAARRPAGIRPGLPRTLMLGFRIDI